MKSVTVHILLILSLITISHTAFGMNNNNNNTIIDQQTRTIVKASLESARYFAVPKFQNYIQTNRAQIEPEALYTAYCTTLRKLRYKQELLLCHRDYIAAFIALNEIKTKSFNSQFIEDRKTLTRNLFREVVGNNIGELDLHLHIANDRWNECTCGQYTFLKAPASQEEPKQ